MNFVYIFVLVAVVTVLTFVGTKLLDRLASQGRRKRSPRDRRPGRPREQQPPPRGRAGNQGDWPSSSRPKAKRSCAELREELHERERLLDKRQDALEEQAEQLRKQEKMVESTQRKLTERIQDANRRKEELAKLLDLQRQTLHELSGLSQDEATRRLLEILDTPAAAGDRRGDPQAREASWPKSARRRSREILLTSIQRYAAAHTAETTTSTVGIPNDEMKGRIIGREGRNIRAFEKATGVDVIIDDTPGVVIVSAFDMIRREVARMSLNKLIADGRIHPTRIEEIVADTQTRAGAAHPEARRSRPARRPTSTACTSGW